MMTSYEHESGGATVLTFFVGAICGAIAGLLLAPVSGHEARSRVRDVATRSRERIARVPRAMREAGSAAKEALTHELS